VYNRQPILFDHASGVEFPDDPDIPEDEQDMPRRYKIGSIIKTVKDEKGLWIEAVLDAHNKWVDGIWKLVDRGALHFSSGSVPHMIKRADDGAVKSWPIIEVSLTPTPAEPRNTKVLNLAGDTTIADQGGAIRRSDLGRRESIAKFSIQLMEDSRGVIKMNNLNRRLRSLLDVYWGAELAAAASSYKAARRAAKQEGVTPEESEIVEEAASKLDELVQPIADQAKSALGVDADEVKAMLYKMALSKCSKQDIPVEDEEVIDEELLEEFPTLDTGMDGEDFEAGPELMDEEPLDQFTDAEDFTDEEEEIMASRRHANIDAVIERELRRLSPRGSYSTKRFNMITTRNTEPSLSRQIKAIRDKDMSILRGTAQRTASHYKALGINPDTAGGFLIVPEQADEVIEILRAKSVFLRVEGDAKTGGAESLVTVLPMNTDTMFIPRQTGGATAYWVGENAQITASDQTFGQIQLVAKKVAAMVKISNELLNDSSTDVDAFIRADISRQLANAVDVAVLRGAGVAGQPMGIKVTPGVSATALNAVPTYTNLTNLVSTVETANVEQDDSWAWIINPRDKSVFRRITDTAGQYIFAGNALQAAELGVPEMLLGYKWIATSNVYNSGGGTPETDIYFGRWRDVVIGMRKTIEIVASDVAGNSFEYDQTYIRAIMRLDIALRHTESIALLTDVRAS
jgi:HK97 family phage major capsid protein